jgi:hypothetical protein
MPTVRAGDLPYQPFNSEVTSPVVPSTYQSIRASAADFGADVGAGLEKLGRSIGQAADVAAEGAIARQEFENKVKADDYTNKYQESVTKLLYGNPDDPTDTGFLGKRGEDAARAYPNVYKSIIDLRNQMRGQLANDKQRLLFDGETRRTQILTLSHMGGHYEREFKNYATAVNKATAENGMAQAATALERGDQAGFEDGIGKRMKAELDQARSAGTANNPEVYNKILGDAREDAVKMNFQKLAETNPYKAWQFLDANSDALKPGEAHALRQTVEAQYRKIRGQIDAGEMPAPEGWNDAPPKTTRSVGPISGGYDFGHMKTLAINAGFQGHDADYMAALAMVESSGNPGAHNPHGEDSYGLTQINARAHGPVAREALNNPQRAFELAKMVYDEQGWGAWRNSIPRAERYLKELGGSIQALPLEGTTVVTKVAPLRVANTKIDYAFGDSNAQLATNHGVAGEKGTDVVVGDSPKASWERMQARGPEFFRGKTILLSPGSSNEPNQVEFIEKQAAFAQQAGVKGMVIPGVGPGIPGGSDKADVLNAQLAGIAEKYGAKFVMPDNWQKDGYHIAQVPKFLEKANAVLQTSASAKSVPVVQGKGQPVTQSQLKGPSGSSLTPEELDVLEGGGGGDAPDEVTEQTPTIKGLKLAPIPPPDPGELPDAQIPGLTERIADIASQPWAKDNPTRLLDAIKAARAGATARWTDAQRARTLANQEAKEISQKTEDQFQSRIYPGSKNMPNEEEIAKAPMTPEAKRSVTGFLRRQEMADPPPGVSKTNTVNIMRRMDLPYGNPNKITEEREITEEYLNQKISQHDFAFAQTQFRNARTFDGERLAEVKKELLDAVTPQIMGVFHGEEGDLIDARAEQEFGTAPRKQRLYNFHRYMNDKIKEYQQEKKNPDDLFNPAKPDYLGKPEALERFRPPMKFRMQGQPTPENPTPEAAIKDLTKIPNDDLVSGVRSGSIDYEKGVAEAVRRGLIRAAPPAPAGPTAPIARP